MTDLSTLSWCQFDTARLSLRLRDDSDPSHRAALVRLLNMPQINRNLSTVPEQVEDDTLRPFEQYFEAEKFALSWMIYLKGQQQPVGFIALQGWPSEGKSYFGYFLDPAFHRQGIMSEAINAVCEFGFDALELKEIRISAFQDNAASAALAQSCGFEKIGEGTAKSLARGDMEVPDETFELTAQAHRKHRMRAGCHSYNCIVHRQLPNLLVSAAALVDMEGRILVAQRPEGKSMAGLWEFPGGKVENGETPEAALIRELDEELGIQTDHSCLSPVAFASHSYAKFHLLMPVFAIRQWRGEPTGQEGQALKWVTPRELWKLPMPPADEPIIPLLNDLL